MRIVIGSPVKGFVLKNAVKEWLEDNGFEVIDVGALDTEDFVKFPSVAERTAKVLQDGEADFGILCCGSGTGVALAVGKFAGICAVSCEGLMTAKLARQVNDANVLCMGESIVAPDTACRMVESFLESDFQDIDGPSAEVLDFWADARNEIMARGPEACDRELETLE